MAMRVPVNKRIALFLPTLVGGGAERSFLSLAKGFNDAGYHVDLILKKSIGEFVDEVPSGVNLIDLGAPRMAAALPGLFRYLRSYRPSVMLTALNLANLIGLMANFLSGNKTRVIVSIRGLFSNRERHLLHDRSLERALMRMLYQHANKIIAPSTQAAQNVADSLGIPVSQIKIIYNPVITPLFINKSLMQLNHPWFAPGEPPVILGVGRLVPVKDYATLILAYKHVREAVSARLVILGEGDERPALESLSQQLGLDNDILLPGFERNPYPYMKRAAVFAHSSRSEAFGNVLVEAMASGCPVVATNCPGGPIEITRAGQYAYLVPVGDAEAMADAILSTLNGEVKKPPPEWLSQFEFQHVIQQYLDLINSCEI